MTRGSTWLIEIPEPECGELVAVSKLGRIAVVIDGRPEIFPVPGEASCDHESTTRSANCERLNEWLLYGGCDRRFPVTFEVPPWDLRPWPIPPAFRSALTSREEKT